MPRFRPPRPRFPHSFRAGVEALDRRALPGHAMAPLSAPAERADPPDDPFAFLLPLTLRDAHRLKAGADDFIRPYSASVSTTTTTDPISFYAPSAASGGGSGSSPTPLVLPPGNPVFYIDGSDNGWWDWSDPARENYANENNLDPNGNGNIANGDHFKGSLLPSGGSFVELDGAGQLGGSGGDVAVIADHGNGTNGQQLGNTEFLGPSDFYSGGGNYDNLEDLYNSLNEGGHILMTGCDVGSNGEMVDAIQDWLADHPDVDSFIISTGPVYWPTGQAPKGDWIQITDTSVTPY